MIEKVNERLALENKMLSDRNIKLNQAYYELLNEYLKCMATKCPANMLLAGQIEWESKIN